MTVAIPEALRKAFRDARHICVLTGAGVSAESGVPTFRDAMEGLWEKHDPRQLATPEGFAEDPKLVWGWYVWRRELVARVDPNTGHAALAELESLPDRLTLVTQNVDGLHQRAGSSDVIEFHGNLFVDRCFAGGHIVETPVEPAADGEPPTCPSCGGPVRPGVVWFGEAIPEDALTGAFAAARDCDLYLSIGTSSEIYPAAGLFEIARSSGATTVEINPDVTEQTAHFDFVLSGKSGQILPELIGAVRRQDL